MHSCISCHFMWHILAINFMCFTTIKFDQLYLPLPIYNLTHYTAFVGNFSKDWTYIHFIIITLLRVPLSLGVITHGWRPEQIELMTCYEWIPKKHSEDGISVVHQFIIASHQSKHSFYLVEPVYMSREKKMHTFDMPIWVHLWCQQSMWVHEGVSQQSMTSTLTLWVYEGVSSGDHKVQYLCQLSF